MAKRTIKKSGPRRKAAKKKPASRKGSSRKVAAGRSRAKTGKGNASAKKTAVKRSIAKRSGGARSKAAAVTRATPKKKLPAIAPAKKKKATAKRTSRGRAPSSAVSGATGRESQQAPQNEQPLPKTHLNDKQLQEFRQLLLHKRAELASDVQQLSREAFGQPGGASAERSTMPIHMADVGSDNWEQEFTLGLIASERNCVQEIDEALQRINNRTYGVCLATRKRISVARLRAKPWAKYCIDYARLRDEGRLS